MSYLRKIVAESAFQSALDAAEQKGELSDSDKSELKNAYIAALGRGENVGQFLERIGALVGRDGLEEINKEVKENLSGKDRPKSPSRKALEDYYSQIIK